MVEAIRYLNSFKIGDMSLARCWLLMLVMVQRGHGLFSLPCYIFVISHHKKQSRNVF